MPGRRMVEGLVLAAGIDQSGSEEGRLKLLRGIHWNFTPCAEHLSVTCVAE